MDEIINILIFTVNRSGCWFLVSMKFSRHNAIEVESPYDKVFVMHVALGWFKIFTLLAIVLAMPNSCSCDVFRETCKVLGSFAKV